MVAFGEGIRGELDMEHQLAAVYWEDSRQPTTGWQWIDNIELQPPVLCVSVGWIIQETEDVLYLAQNMGDISSDRKQTSGVMHIATSCIIETIWLTKPKPKVKWLRRFNPKAEAGGSR